MIIIINFNNLTFLWLFIDMNPLQSEAAEALCVDERNIIWKKKILWEKKLFNIMYI